jgi:hypothetical protein
MAIWPTDIWSIQRLVGTAMTDIWPKGIWGLYHKTLQIRDLRQMAIFHSKLVSFSIVCHKHISLDKYTSLDKHSSLDKHTSLI